MTIDMQIRAIRTAVKSLQYDRLRIQRSAEDGHAEALADIDIDIVALNAAIETIKSSEAFKAALKTFLA